MITYSEVITESEANKMIEIMTYDFVKRYVHDFSEIELYERAQEYARQIFLEFCEVQNIQKVKQEI